MRFRLLGFQCQDGYKIVQPESQKLKRDGLIHVEFWLVLFLQIPIGNNVANDIKSIT